MRLSKEDERRKESASIETQRKILRAYCREKGFGIREEYIDDGYSGTEMETRPALQKLLSDIKTGGINLVLCKDLSRLGRNIGDTAMLLDKFFPQYRVRFISVTEGTDTEKRDRAQRVLTPLHNFTNELYAADISDKIHAALHIKIQNGEYIGSFAPYGYEKEPGNKNHLVPDMAAAVVVREIFAQAAKGKKPADIAACLNEKAIRTPSSYRAEKYPSADGAFPKAESWTGGMVGKILRNQVYIGNTVQGKTEKPSFKCKVTYALPRENWTVVKNTHEPLVCTELWDAVRGQVGARKNERQSGFRNELSGIAVCADCGRNMSTAFSHGRAYLVCGGYKAGGNKKCSAHRIGYTYLLDAVGEKLNRIFGNCEDIRGRVEKIEVGEEKDGDSRIGIFFRNKAI